MLIIIWHIHNSFIFSKLVAQERSPQTARLIFTYIYELYDSHHTISHTHTHTQHTERERERQKHTHTLEGTHVQEKDQIL